MPIIHSPTKYKDEQNMLKKQIDISAETEKGFVVITVRNGREESSSQTKAGDGGKRGTLLANSLAKSLNGFIEWDATKNESDYSTIIRIPIANK